jgi:hypothetical protein
MPAGTAGARGAGGRVLGGAPGELVLTAASGARVVDAGAVALVVVPSRVPSFPTSLAVPSPAEPQAPARTITAHAATPRRAARRPRRPRVCPSVVSARRTGTRA